MKMYLSFFRNCISVSRLLLYKTHTLYAGNKYPTSCISTHTISLYELHPSKILFLDILNEHPQLT